MNNATQDEIKDRLRHLIIKSGTAQGKLRLLRDRLIWAGNDPDCSEEEKERKKASIKIEIEEQQKIVDECEPEIAELKKKIIPNEKKQRRKKQWHTYRR